MADRASSGIAAVLAGTHFPPFAPGASLLSAASTALPLAKLADIACTGVRVEDSDLGDIQRKRLLQDLSLTIADQHYYQLVASTKHNVRPLVYDHSVPHRGIGGTEQSDSDHADGVLPHTVLLQAAQAPNAELMLSVLETLVPEHLQCSSSIELTLGETVPLGSAIALEASTATADPADRGFPAKYAINPDGADQACRFKSGASLCLWTVRLSIDAPVIAAVHVAWDRDAAPAAVLLQLGDGSEWVLADAIDVVGNSPSSIHKAALYSDVVVSTPTQNGATIPACGSVLSCMRRVAGGIGSGAPSPVHSSPTHMRLVMSGFHPTNTRKQIGIRSVTAYTFNCWSGGPVAPEPDGNRLLGQLRPEEKILPTMLDAVEENMRQPGDGAKLGRMMQSLSVMTLVTGSLAVPLHIAARLLAMEDREMQPVCAAALRRYAAVLESTQQWRMRRARALVWIASVANASAVALPTWDADGKCDRHLTISDGGSTASCTSADERHQVALGSTGFPLRGKHSWTIRVAQDIPNDECICAGLGVWPVRETEYTRTTDMWLVRCYNGQLYGRMGSKAIPGGKIPHGGIRPNSEMTFTLDGDARTVSLSVDHVAQGVIFNLPSNAELNASALATARAQGRNISSSDLPPPLIYPAVSFYAAGRKATLVSVHTERVKPPVPWETASLAAMPLMELPDGGATEMHSTIQGVPASSPRGTPQLVGSIAFGGELPHPLEGAVSDGDSAPSGVGELIAAALTQQEVIPGAGTVTVLPEGSQPPSRRVCLRRRLYENTVALQPDARIMRALLKKAVATAWTKAALPAAVLTNMEDAAPADAIVTGQDGANALPPSRRRGSGLRLDIDEPRLCDKHEASEESASAVVAVARWRLSGAWDTLTFGLGCMMSADTPSTHSLLESGQIEVRLYGSMVGDHITPGKLLLSTRNVQMGANADAPGAYTVDVRDVHSVALVLVAHVQVHIEPSGATGWSRASSEGLDFNAHLATAENLGGVVNAVTSDWTSHFRALPIIVLTEPRLGPAPIGYQLRVDQVLREAAVLGQDSDQITVSSCAADILSKTCGLVTGTARIPASEATQTSVSQFATYVEGIVPFPGIITMLQESAPVSTPQVVPQTPAGMISRAAPAGVVGRSTTHAAIGLGGIRVAPSAPVAAGIGPAVGSLTAESVAMALRAAAAAHLSSDAPPMRVPEPVAAAPAAAADRRPPSRGLTMDDDLMRATELSLAEELGSATTSGATAVSDVVAPPVSVPAPPFPAPIHSALDQLLTLMSAEDIETNFGMSVEEVDEELASALLLSMQPAEAAEASGSVAEIAPAAPTDVAMSSASGVARPGSGSSTGEASSSGEHATAAEATRDSFLQLEAQSSSSSRAAGMLITPAEPFGTGALASSSALTPVAEQPETPASAPPEEISGLPASTESGVAAIRETDRVRLSVEVFGIQWFVDAGSSEGVAIDNLQTGNPALLSAIRAADDLEDNPPPLVSRPRATDGSTGTVQSPPDVEQNVGWARSFSFANLRELPQLAIQPYTVCGFSAFPTPATWMALCSLLESISRTAPSGSSCLHLLPIVDEALRSASLQSGLDPRVSACIVRCLQPLKNLALFQGASPSQYKVKNSAEACLMNGLHLLYPSHVDKVETLLGMTSFPDKSWQRQLLHAVSWDAVGCQLIDFANVQGEPSCWMKLLESWLPLSGVGPDADDASAQPSLGSLSSPRERKLSSKDNDETVRHALLSTLLRCMLAKISCLLLDSAACANARTGQSLSVASSLQQDAVGLLAHIGGILLPGIKTQLFSFENDGVVDGEGALKTSAALLGRQFLLAMSVFVARIPVALRAAEMLMPTLEAALKVCPSTPPVPQVAVNVLNGGRPANRDNFTGQVGMRVYVPFTNGSGSLVVEALGRYVDPIANSGQLQHAHTLSLWQEADGQLLAQAVVDNSSPRDANGFAVGVLRHALVLQPGSFYRVSSSETAGSGDPWNDPYVGAASSQVADAHDSSLIMVLGDCFVDMPGAWPGTLGVDGAGQQDGGITSSSTFSPTGQVICYPAYNTGKPCTMGPVTMFAYPHRALRNSIGSKFVQACQSTTLLIMDVLVRASAVLISGAVQSEEEEALQPWVRAGFAQPSFCGPLSGFLSCTIASFPLPSSRRLCYTNIHATLHVPANVTSSNTDLTHHLSFGREQALLPVIVSGTGDVQSTVSISDEAWGLLLVLCDADEDGGMPGKGNAANIEMPLSATVGAQSILRTDIPPAVKAHAERLRTARAALVLEDIMQSYGPESKVVRRKPRYNGATGPLIAALLYHTNTIETAARALECKLRGTLPESSPALAGVWQKFKAARAWLRSAVADVRSHEVDVVEAEASIAPAATSLESRRRRVSSSEAPGTAPGTPFILGEPTGQAPHWRGGGLDVTEQRQSDGLHDRDESENGEGTDAGHEGEEVDGEEEEGERDEEEEEVHDEEEDVEDEDERAAGRREPRDSGRRGDGEVVMPITAQSSTVPALFALRRRKARLRRERSAAWAPVTVAQLISDVRQRSLYLLSLDQLHSRQQGAPESLLAPLLEALVRDADQEGTALAEARAALLSEDIASGVAGGDLVGTLIDDKAFSAALTLALLYVRHGSAANPRVLIGCHLRATVRAMQRIAGLQLQHRVLQQCDGSSWPVLLEVALRYLPSALASSSHAEFETYIAEVLAVCHSAVLDRDALAASATEMGMQAYVEGSGLEFCVLPTPGAYSDFLADARGGTLPRMLLRAMANGDVSLAGRVPGCEPSLLPADSQMSRKGPQHPRYRKETARVILSARYVADSTARHSLPRNPYLLLGATTDSVRGKVSASWEDLTLLIQKSVLALKRLSRATLSTYTAASCMSAMGCALRSICIDTPLLSAVKATSFVSFLRNLARFDDEPVLLGHVDAPSAIPSPTQVQCDLCAGRISKADVIGYLQLIDGGTMQKACMDGVPAKLGGELSIADVITAYGRLYRVVSDKSGSELELHVQSASLASSFWFRAMTRAWLKDAADVVLHFALNSCTFAYGVASLRDLALAFTDASIPLAQIEIDVTGANVEDDMAAEHGVITEKERIGTENTLWRLTVQQFGRVCGLVDASASLVLLRHLTVELAELVSSSLKDSERTVAEAAALRYITIMMGVAGVELPTSLWNMLASPVLIATLFTILRSGWGTRVCSPVLRLLQRLLPNAQAESIADATEMGLPALSVWRNLAGEDASVRSLPLFLLSLILSWSQGCEEDGFVQPMGDGNDVRMCAGEVVALLRLLQRNDRDWASFLSGIVRSAVQATAGIAVGSNPTNWRTLPAIHAVPESPQALALLRAAVVALRLVSSSSGLESIRAGARVIVRKSPLLFSDTHTDAHGLIGGGTIIGITEGIVADHRPGCPIARIVIKQFGDFGDVIAPDYISMLGAKSQAAGNSAQRMPYTLLLSGVQQRRGDMLDSSANNTDTELVDLSMLVAVDREPPFIDSNLELAAPARTLSNSFVGCERAAWLMSLIALSAARIPEDTALDMAGTIFLDEDRKGAPPLVISEQIELFCMLRLLALGTLEQTLNIPSSANALLAKLEGEDGHRSALLRLIDVASRPVQSSTFLAPARLKAQEAALHSLVIERRGVKVMGPGSGHAFNVGSGLPPGIELLAPTPAKAPSPRRPQGSGAAGIPPGTSEADVARQEKALQLFSMGFGFDVEQCMTALRMRGDDLNRAVDLLMTPEARRLIAAESDLLSATATSSQVTGPIASGFGLGGLGHAAPMAATKVAFTSENARNRKALDLAGLYSVPVPLCYQALLIKGDDANEAMAWLLEGGSAYVEAMMDEGAVVEAANADTQAEVEAEARAGESDAAALENMGGSPPLIDAIDARADTAGAEGDAAQAVRRRDALQPRGPQGTDYTGRSQFDAAQLRGHRAAVGMPELHFVDLLEDLPASADRQAAALTRILSDTSIFVTRYTGPIDELDSSPLGTGCARGSKLACIGVVMVPSSNTSTTVVCVESRDPVSGESVLRGVLPSAIRVSKLVYGTPVSSTPQLWALQAAAVSALARHVARRLVAVAIHHWPAKVPMTLSVLGGGLGITRLLKLSAASSASFGSSSLDSSDSSDVGFDGVDPYAVLSRVGFGQGFRSETVVLHGTEAAMTEIIVLPALPNGQTKGVAALRAPALSQMDAVIRQRGDTDTSSASTPVSSLHRSPQDGLALPRFSEFVVDDENVTAVAANSVLDVLRTMLLRLLLNEVRSSQTISKQDRPHLPRSVKKIPVDQCVSVVDAVGTSNPNIPGAVSPSPLAVTPQRAQPVPSPGLDELPALDLSFSSQGASPMQDLDGGAISASLVAPQPMQAQAEQGLSTFILEDCVRNFVATTTSVGATGSGAAVQTRRLVFESLHPVIPECDYMSEVIIDRARAFRIMFDPRCELYATNSTLTFYSDKGCTLQLASYPVRPAVVSSGEKLKGHAAFPPLVVQSDRVYIRFRSDRKEAMSLVWGYRFVASAMRGLAWSNEAQALSESESSLQWACWCLDFLLQDAGSCSAELFSAAHAAPIFDALVRYVRTPNAPFKAAVATLLTRLLMHPQAFKDNDLPDMRSLVHVADLIVHEAALVRGLERGRSNFLPPALLRLVELAAATYKADREIGKRMSSITQGVDEFPSASSDREARVGAGFSPVRIAISDSFRVVPTVKPTLLKADDDLTFQGNLIDAADLAASLQSAPSVLDLRTNLSTLLVAYGGSSGPQHASLLRSGAVTLPECSWILDAAQRAASSQSAYDVSVAANMLPSPFLCRAWLDSCAHVAVVDSSHPYISGQCKTGWVVVPGATSIRIALDRRSKVADGCSLRFWGITGEPIRFCGTMAADSKLVPGQSVPGVTPGDMKTWTADGTDVADLTGDRVRWEWVAPSVASADAPLVVPVLMHPEAGLDCPEGSNEAPGAAANPLGLWGFAFTVSAMTWRVVPGSRSARQSEVALLRYAAQSDRLDEPAIETPTASSPTEGMAAPVPGALTLSQAAVYMSLWPRELDAMLVNWLSTHSSRMLGAEDDADVPHTPAATGGSRRTVRSALDASPADVRLSRKEWNFSYEPLARVPIRALHLRVALLKLWNRRISRLLELVDVHAADVAARAEVLAVVLAAVGGRAGKGRTGQVGFDPTRLTAGATLLSVQLRSLGHLVFSELKQRVLDAALALTASGILRTMPRPSISVDNMRAMASIDAGTIDISSSSCSFMQAYKQLARHGPTTMSALCRSPIDDRGRVWTVRFVGEEGIDYGGVFRDALTRMVEDCFTADRFDLQLPCPNALMVTEAGAADAPDIGSVAGSEKFIPNPAYAQPAVAGRSKPMFEFLGRLAGMSLRLKLSLAFEWPSLVWKGLVGTPVDLEDLRAIDARKADHIQAVAAWCPVTGILYADVPAGPAAARTPGSAASSRTPLFRGNNSITPGGGSNRSPMTPFLRQTPGSSVFGPVGLAAPSPAALHRTYAQEAEAAFCASFPGLCFTALGYDGRKVELVPGGQRIRVTLSNRWHYLECAVAFALTSMEPLIRHIRRGMYSVVPPRACRLLTWHELETAVSGKPEVDLRLLKAHTDYEGYRVTDAPVTHFWRVMEGFTQEERSLFIRFAWGRSRLPTGRRWPKRFKITRRAVADMAGLPLAHTCFFSIELPPYPTEERMRSALLAAIHYGSGGILNA